MKMQNVKLGEIIREFLNQEESYFQEIQGGSFVRVDTGELFTKAEHDKYIQKKIEIFKVEMFAETNSVVNDNYDIENNQRLINKKSKPKKSKKTKERLDNGEFNIVYRDKITEVFCMKLNSNEKLVYYVLRDFIQYPTNSVAIMNEIPTTEQLEQLIGLSGKSIIKALKSLEEKNLLKRKQSGHKKVIYINPDYCASGKDLDIETLAMFGLVECDDRKIDEYLNMINEGGKN